MLIVPSSDSFPDSLIVGLADRDVSLWICGTISEPAKIKALAAMLRLPWKQVFIEDPNRRLVEELGNPDSESLVRRRGFVHVIDSDPSRFNLPSRALPIFLLAGRNGDGSAFERQLRQMTMLEELRRSNVRQLVVVGNAEKPFPTNLEGVWDTGFRTRLMVVDADADASQKLTAWLGTHGQGPTASVVSLAAEDFAERLVASFSANYEDVRAVIRQRDEAGAIHQIDLTDIDDPERPVLEKYDLILDQDCITLAPEELPEDAFNGFFRGEFDNWRAFAAGLPWIRDNSAWRGLQAQLGRIDSAGAQENRITYLTSESGAGGTTFVRQLAYTAAKAGYPTLIAKGAPFTPDALPLINFLTRARQRADESRSVESSGGESPGRLYETPWLLVFDRIHWESRDNELRRFLQQVGQAGRAVCILVVTGPLRPMAYRDESRFKCVAQLTHLLGEDETIALGRHLNRFLRNYGKERPEWQWSNFQATHSVRYLEGLAAFWVTLAFWLQSQYDLSESLQDWIYKAFQQHADTPEIRKAIVQIAALSSERLPMPESLIEQGASAWPVPLLLDDKRGELSPLGLVRLSNAGRKYWAMAHDILGRLVINALFFDYEARSMLGFASARDAQHLRFLILREVSCKAALGEVAERDYGEEFATNVFKIDPGHGRVSWIHIWREVLDALDNMPAPLRNGSRVFRHHTAISRRRIVWLPQEAYEISDTDKVSLLERAAADITYALHSIEGMSGDESDVNLYNSLANTYFDLARVRADQGASPDELAALRKMASDATRHAYEQNPSSPYVIETHVKNLITTAEAAESAAPGFCIEALEIVYAAIRNDRKELRRDALGELADRAVAILLASGTGARQRAEPASPTEVLVSAWVDLAAPFEGRAPESLEVVPAPVLTSVLSVLDHPAGAGNAQVAQLRYQVLVAAQPYHFEPQLQTLDLLVNIDYRLSPQLRLEYALLLFQQMRTEEGNRQFKNLRALWREIDVFVQVPHRLRWLLQAGSDQPRVVHAVSAYDHGHRAMARVREFADFDVPYRPQEFGVREHRSNTVFSAHVSFGHNGPFLRPTNASRQ
jgi:hypothetical protein